MLSLAILGVSEKFLEFFGMVAVRDEDAEKEVGHGKFKVVCAAIWLC